MKLLKLSFLIFLVCSNIFSQQAIKPDSTQLSKSSGTKNGLYHINDSTDYFYGRPHLIDPFKYAVSDLYLVPMELTKKKNIPAIIAVAASSLVLIHYDEKITQTAKRFGRYIGLSTNGDVHNLSPIKNLPFNVPTTFSSGLYYIGDGMTELAVDAGFLIYGSVYNDERALSTASELTEGMITVGVFVQILKHLSGRESPTHQTAPGGVWRWFPSWKEYYSSVPAHDAFPSGHLATAMVTATVISMNYPEYKFIKPVCYSLMGLCGYQMLNNGVHWMGDYPLALALGYSIGRIAVNREREIISHPQMHSSEYYVNKFHPKLRLTPVILFHDVSGVQFAMLF